MLINYPYNVNGEYHWFTFVTYEIVMHIKINGALEHPLHLIRNIRKVYLQHSMLNRAAKSYSCFAVKSCEILLRSLAATFLHL